MCVPEFCVFSPLLSIEPVSYTHLASLEFLWLAVACKPYIRKAPTHNIQPTPYSLRTIHQQLMYNTGTPRCLRRHNSVWNMTMNKHKTFIVEYTTSNKSKRWLNNETCSVLLPCFIRRNNRMIYMIYEV